MKSASTILKMKQYSEPVFLALALVLLWVFYPAGESGTTLCIFHHIGITWCPGCGIGRSMAHFLHGNIQDSLHAHWFGIPAVMIMGYRLLEILKTRIPKILTK